MADNLCGKFTHYRDLASSGKYDVLLNLVVTDPGEVFYVEYFAPAGLPAVTAWETHVACILVRLWILTSNRHRDLRAIWEVWQDKQHWAPAWPSQR